MATSRAGILLANMRPGQLKSTMLVLLKKTLEGIAKQLDPERPKELDFMKRTTVVFFHILTYLPGACVIQSDLVRDSIHQLCGHMDTEVVQLS